MWQHIFYPSGIRQKSDAVGAGVSRRVLVQENLRGALGAVGAEHRPVAQIY